MLHGDDIVEGSVLVEVLIDSDVEIFTHVDSQIEWDVEELLFPCFAHRVLLEAGVAPESNLKRTLVFIAELLLGCSIYFIQCSVLGGEIRSVLSKYRDGKICQGE